METWRYIDSGESDGQTNMAIDDLLATQIVPEMKIPVFRVYRWNPYTISLGYHQNPDELNLKKCANDSIGIVKRPTGGRAVFHAEEVTYSVILPRESMLYAQDVLTTYNSISEGLLEGLKLFGVNADLVERLEIGSKSSDYKNNIPCFSSSAKYEIAFNNKKLVGSAQRRFENSILQHGSILTGPYHLKLADYVKLKDISRIDAFKKALDKKTISISQIISKPIIWAEITAALKEGFQKKFGIHFTDSKLTPRELAGVKNITKKY